MSFILELDIFLTNSFFYLHKTSVKAASLVYPRRTTASVLNNKAPKSEHDSPNLIKNEHKMKIASYGL